MHDQRLVQRLFGPGGFAFLLGAEAVHHQCGEFALFVAAQVAAQILGDASRTLDPPVVEQCAREVGVVVEDFQRRSLTPFKDSSIGSFGSGQILVACGDVADHALTQGIVW